MRGMPLARHCSGASDQALHEEGESLKVTQWPEVGRAPKGERFEILIRANVNQPDAEEPFNLLICFFGSHTGLYAAYRTAYVPAECIQRFSIAMLCTTRHCPAPFN